MSQPPQPQPRTCNACGGQRGTDKVEYSYEPGPDGKTVATEHRYWSPCSSCGGTGQIV